MRHKKILAALLVLLSVLTVFSFAASALSWDGSSAGGSTNAVNGSATGYVIRATNDSNCVVGYRFSVVNSSGGMKVNKVIDVFRNTSNGNNAYSTSAKFSVKYNKKQLIANKNAKLTTTLNTTNCIKESAMGFATALPNPSGVETWQAYEANINKVLSKLGVGTTSNMVYGDKVIIEPLFDICLAGEYQALTVSEIAYCGRSIKGGSSDGGKSNGTSSTWGFISNYTNRIWPNKLYTPDGQGLWTSASTIASSTKATFNTILTKGYGAGIAYNETANLTYTIKFNGNGSTGGSTASMSMVKDVSKNLTANGFTKTGYTFKNWNKKTDGSGTTYKNKQSVKNLTSTQGATVNLYAQWKPNTYTISFNGNGKTGGSTASMSMTYDTAKKLTANGFTKTGYSFSGWNTKSNGSGTSYKNKQNVKNLTSANGATITLYARWTPNKYTVSYNANGGSGAPAVQTKSYGVDLTLSSNKPTRTGYTFVKWNTKSDGTGINYNSGAAYTGNANLTLYAVWTPIKYTVTYNANGGSGVPGNQTKTYGVALTLSSTKPTRTGYTFSKWNTKADGTGTNYNSGAKYTDNANLTLYAVWTPIKYTVTYNANGGSGAPGNQTKSHGVDLTLSSTKPTRTGYTFSKWNTKADGTGTNYNSGAKYTSNANLTLYAQWKEERKLSLEPITPNSSYREDTEVITSFNLVNSGTKNCVPSENVSVLFKVYKDSTVMKTITETQVVVPANDKNLLYFKWTVPKNIGSSTIYISGEIIETGTSYGLVKRSYPTCKYTVSSTPDTQYEISAPSGFTVPGVPTEKNDIATWNEWSYTDGVFKKTSYGIGFSCDKPKITPAASANAAFNNGVWTMKSGYGVEMALVNGIKSVSGYAMPNADSYTLSQYAVAKFPEFSYLISINKYRTLELASNQWIFRQNGSYGRLHFTPLWYPDGNYTATVEQSDLWTPAGSEPFETTLSTGEKAGFEAYSDAVRFWRGDSVTPEREAWERWFQIEDSVYGMILLEQWTEPNALLLPNEDRQIALLETKSKEDTTRLYLPQAAIDYILCRGSGVSEGKMRVYRQFSKSLSKEDNIKFLKNEYGMGGSSDAIPGSGYWESHDAKGISISDHYSVPERRILLSWNQIEKRISELIRLDRYLNAKEKEVYPKWLEKHQEQRIEQQAEAERKELAQTALPETKEYEYQFHLGDTVIERDVFNLVQQEKARRAAKSKKSDRTITELGKYSGKYVLSEILVCGECGSPYRRRTINSHGEKKIYWRCLNRIEHGKQYCKKSIGIEECKLHEAICRALSGVLPNKEEILKTVKATLEYAVSGDNDTLNRYNIELNIKQLQSEADMLMERAANTEGDTERYFTEIEKLYDKIKILRQQLEMLQANVNVQNSTDVEVKRIAEILEKEDFSFTEFDDGVIRRIVECIRVMGDKSIVVILKGGFEVTEVV